MATKAQFHLKNKLTIKFQKKSIQNINIVNNDNNDEVISLQIIILSFVYFVMNQESYRILLQITTNVSILFRSEEIRQ